MTSFQDRCNGVQCVEQQLLCSQFHNLFVGTMDILEKEFLKSFQISILYLTAFLIIPDSIVQ